MGSIGFTGTRSGLTDKQKETLLIELKKLQEAGYRKFHHGDCIGADAEAHDIAESLGYDIIIHPPINPTARAFKKGKITLENKDYLIRNHDIVDQTSYLLVCPKEDNEQLRSGTWATYRYAVSKLNQGRLDGNKPTIKVIFSDGNREYREYGKVGRTF